MKSSTRIFGIDLLRIASMLGVVFLHVLGHGGILNLKHSTINFSTVWFWETLAYPSVNCFVLVSGFVGYKDDNIYPKLKNLLSLLFTVAFYSIGIFLVFTWLGMEPFGLKALAKTLLPTIYKKYWFFSIYFGLFLLSPLLNLLVQKSNSKQAFGYLCVFLLLSVISTIYDTFSMQDGYSLAWFIFIYLIGAIIKKYKLQELLSKKWWLIIALLSFVVTWGSKIALHFSGISFLTKHSSLLVKYVSPTVVFMAIALLCLFSKINCKPSLGKIIAFFSASAFSVYLIHDNSIVRKHFISKLHTFIGNANFVLLSGHLVCCVCAIFLACIFIDKVRMLIFKAIKIDKLSEKLEKLINSIVNTIYATVKEIAE